MIRHQPKFNYNGLTIILSNGRRFDKTELLTGVAGWFFNNDCIQPEANRWQCDIRLITDTSPLLSNTKVILLLGEHAHRLWHGIGTTIDEHRGSPIVKDGIICISSFLPQDCIDMVDHESRLNPD